MTDDKDPIDAFDFLIKGAEQYKPTLRTVQTPAQAKAELEQEKIEWNESCEKNKKEETEIDRLCYNILGEVPVYEMTFEEWKKGNDEGRKESYF